MQFYLGYKVNQRVNVFIRQVVHDLLESGELPHQHKKHSIYGPSPVGAFKFCMIRKMMPSDSAISDLDSFLVRSKYFIRRMVGSPVKWYGLETSNVIVEYVPLFLPSKPDEDRLDRI